MKYVSKLIASTLAGAAILAGPAVLAQQQSPTSTTDSRSQSQLTGQQPVSFDKVPAPAQHAIRAQAGQGSITSVNRATWNGTAYEAVYEKTGKPVYVQVAPDGTILNRSTVRTEKTPLKDSAAVTFDQLPADVQKVFTSSAGTSPITKLTKGTWQGTVYQAKLGTPGANGANEILVTADGTAFKQPGALTEAAGASQSSSATPTGITMAFKDLPWTVQKPMLDNTSYAKITSVTETKLPDGRKAYVGTYTKDNQLHQITVDDKGAMVSDQVTGPAPSQ